MRASACLAALIMTASMPASAQSLLGYEAAIRAALVARGCSVDVRGEEAELAFSRQLGLKLGVPALAVSDRTGIHYPALTRAVSEMAKRGVLQVEGTRMSLTDCRA